MDRTTTLSIIAALAVLNGMLSPFTVLVWHVAPVWYPSLILPLNATILTYLTSLLTATLLFVLSGIPAALYERFTGQAEAPAAHWIWVITAGALSLPTLAALAQA